MEKQPLVVNTKEEQVKPSLNSMYIIKSIMTSPAENVPEIEILGRVCTLDFSILPLELQEIVVRNLDSKTSLMLRASCRKWKQMVDDYGLFDVMLNERQGFNGTLSLPMRKCEINWLKSPKMRSVFMSSPPKEVIVKKGMSQWIVKEMLKGWKTMTCIRFGWRALASTYLFQFCTIPSTNKRVLLGNLHTLKLEITQAPDTNQNEYITLTKNLEFLLSWNYPKLERLNVTFVFTPLKESFLDMIFPFICRHASTLRTFEVSLKYSLSHQQCMNFQHAILFESVPWPTRRGLFSCVKDVRVTTWTLDCPFRNADRIEFWKDALANRSVLGHAIASRFLCPHLSRLSHFSSAFTLYSIYLQRIDIVNMSIYSFGENIKSEPANFALLEECVNLRYLSIRRAPIVLVEAQPLLLIEIINVASLPKYITHLRLEGFHVCSTDLKHSLKNMENLKSFELLRSAANPPDLTKHNYSNVGVNQEVFLTILTHPNLLVASCHFLPCVLSSCPEPHANNNRIFQLVRKHRWKSQFSNSWSGCLQVDLCRFKSVIF